MATLQNRQIVRKPPPAPPASAGRNNVYSFEYVHTVATVAADIIELGVLPAGARPLRVSFTTANIAAVATMDVGFLTGNYGDLTAVRTMAAIGEIINDGARNTTIVVTPETLAAITSTKADRGIGVQWSLAEAAGATKTYRLILEYYFD